MKIPLTQGKFAIVGSRDCAYLMQWKWCFGCGYAVHRNGKQTIYMHRVILERMGFKNFSRSDHINRNRLDNRRCNLRVATARQSQCNRGKQSNNTSSYTGVSWDTLNEKWRAQIYVNKERISLGYYDNLREAAKIYNKAALKYHGEFAVLNRI